MRALAETLAAWPRGRWIALAGGAAAALVCALGVTGSDSLAGAVAKGCGTGFAVMVFLGVFQRFWGGAKISQAGAPGGWSVGFGATRKAVGELNDRVNDQMTTLNERLYDLEKVVFKDRATDTEAQD